MGVLNFVANTYERIAPAYFRRWSSNFLLEYIRAEDDQTKSVDIGPVNKVRPFYRYHCRCARLLKMLYYLCVLYVFGCFALQLLFNIELLAPAIRGEQAVVHAMAGCRHPTKRESVLLSNFGLFPSQCFENL